MWCGEFGENTLAMLSSTLDLFDAQSPGLAGWSFWTWKRALPSGWAILHGIAQPPRWSKLIEWAVNGTGPVPTPEESRAAMEDFLQAADFARLSTHPALQTVLSTHGRLRPGQLLPP
jgi:hypothetical protein